MTGIQLLFVVSGTLFGLLLFGGARPGMLAGSARGVSHHRSALGSALAPDAGTIAMRGLVVAGCAGAGWALLGGVLGVLAGLGAGLAAWLGLSRLESGASRRRTAVMRARFAAVLELMAGVVDAGAPLRAAAEQVGDIVGAPHNEPLTTVVAACRVGCTDAEAWMRLADDPLWCEVARELARSVESGAASAGILRGRADQARRTRAAALMTRARSVGVMSALPLMCCFLPAFLLVGVVPIIGGLVGTYLP